MAIRLGLLQNIKLIIVVLGAGLLFIITVKLTVANDLPIEKANCHESIKIYPDMIVSDGDRFHTLAVSPDTGRKTIYYARFQSLEQKQRITGSSRPLILTVTGEQQAINEATNINQFDMRAFYHHQKVYDMFSVSEIESLRPLMHESIADRIHDLRSRFNHYCRGLPKMLRIYAMGLISGNRESNFFEEMTGAQQLGLLHIFSISGMHVYYFLTVIDRLLTILGLGKKVKIVIKSACLAGYYLFSGGTPSLLRAVLTAAIVMLGQLVEIKVSPLAALSLTLMIHLFLLPEAMFMMSVQLSYGLAFGLIAVSKRSFLKQTVLLNLLSLPILLFHLYEWHVLSLAVNLMVLPLFGSTIFPLVLLGLGLGLINPQLTGPVEWLLRTFNDGLNLVGRLPGMILFGKPPVLIALLMFGLTLIVIIHLGKKLKICWAALIGLYLGTFIWIHYPLHGEVTMFDVGQGDSFLIRTPFNRSVTLIDTGGKPIFNQQKWQRGTENHQAARISINYLKSIGISQIDSICISHQDADHCGDLQAFIREMRIKQIVIPLGMQQNTNFMKRLAGKAPETLVLPVNDESRVSGLPLTVLHPYLSGKGGNGDSEVLSGRFGGLNWLFMGDLDQPGEMATLQRHPGLKADVIKVGHHGSRTSSNPQFISQIQPRLALISAGRNNRYHHPNEETLVTLNKAHVKILNTQKSGMVRYVYRNNTGCFQTKLELKGESK